MAQEGDYTAALRGSNSDQWQALKPPASTAPRSGGNPSAGSCYRCGQGGHWSRDCSMPATGKAGGIQHPPAMNPGAVSSKPCPCGAGMCVVRTSNTARNPGRQFLTCPALQEAKCNFFEWCDAAGAPPRNQPSQAQQQQLPGEPELKCRNCNQPCAVFTAKTEKNAGRRFYKCKNEECHFFKWCDEAFAPSSSPGYKASAGYGGYGGGPSRYGNPAGAYGGDGNVFSGYGGPGFRSNTGGGYGSHGNVSSGYGGPGFGSPSNTGGGYGGRGSVSSGYGASGPDYSGGYGARGNVSSGFGGPGNGHNGRGCGDYGNA